eukprot:Nk52_evm1s1814 gene=Nk52_evmTU1s1814
MTAGSGGGAPNIPPKYADIGKETKDLFSKEYNQCGKFGLEFSSRTQSGIKFKHFGERNSSSGAIFGAFETKSDIFGKHLSATANWNTRNSLSGKISSSDFLSNGLDLSFAPCFSAASGWKSANLTASYAQEGFASEVDVSFVDGPAVKGSVVVGGGSNGSGGASAAGGGGIHAGMELVYNVKDGTFTDSEWRATYEEMELGVKVGGSMKGMMNSFTASVYHNSSNSKSIGHNCETATLLEYKRDSGQVLLGVAAQYRPHSSMIIKGKVNNYAQFNVVLVQKLSDNIKLSLSACLDGQRWGSNAHMMGLNITADV